MPLPSNPPGEFMNALLRSMTLLAVFAYPGLAAAQQATGSFQRTLTVTGPVDLEVLTGSGRIDVRTGQAGRIEIDGQVKAGDWELFRRGLSPQERVRRIEATPPIEQRGAKVTIGRIDDEELRNVSISYTLRVPPETTLTAKTGSGSHLIEGVHGAINASAGSGSIRVRDAGSEVRASTGSGSIVADTVAGSFVANTGSGSIDGINVNGGITVNSGSGDIKVSQSGAGAVEASSGSGSIRLNGVRGSLRASTSSGTLLVQGEQTSDWRLSASSGSVTIELTGKPAFTLDAHSSSGRIDTQYPITVGRIDRRALRGSVNGGGPLLQVRTSSGGIHIR
jgi:hypothetical protein